MADIRHLRILIITRNLPPLWGGMERLNWHLADQLSRRATVRVVGPAGAAGHAPQGVRVYEAPLKPLSNFLLRAQWLALRLACSWRPDIVLAGSGLTAPLAWLAARACGAKAVAYVHGLDISVPHPVYRHLWLPLLRRMDHVIANSRATAELATRAGIDPARIGVVYPGVRLPKSPPDPQAAIRFRTEHGLGDRALLLSVGRLTRRKGLREFVAEVLPHIVADQPDVMLLVVGDAPAHSLHAEAQTPQSIQAAADSSGVGAHLKFLGVITGNDRLDAAYQAADVHVFPVRHIADDPEGFGMVAVEAAAHGLPTVAYATGGVVDAVAEGISGHLIRSGDGAEFAAAVLRLLARPLPADGVRAHAEPFAWEQFGAAVTAQLHEPCM